MVLPGDRADEAQAALVLPKSLVLPLQGSAGDASRPLVAPGDAVQRGQALSEAVGLLARVRRAPLAGRVLAVERRPVMAPPQGLGEIGGPALVDCVVLGELAPHSGEAASQAWRDLDPAERARRLGAAGLDGVDGLPLDLELELLPPHAKILLRCAELQTGASAFDWLLAKRSAELETALESLLEVDRFDEAVLFHAPWQKEAAGRLEAQFDRRLRSRRLAIKEGHPWDHPRLLAWKAGFGWPDARRPLASQGLLVLDLDRLLRLSRRLSREDYGSALLLSVATLAGGESGLALAGPPVLRRFLPGTPVGFVRRELGLRSDDLLLFGGPFDGRPVLDDGIPLPEGLRQLSILPATVLPVAREEACISCGQCLDICPVRLAPVRLVQLVQEGRLEEARGLGLEDCLDCGLCSWHCPSRIHLGHGLRSGLQGLKEARRAS